MPCLYFRISILLCSIASLFNQYMAIINRFFCNLNDGGTCLRVMLQNDCSLYEKKIWRDSFSSFIGVFQLRWRKFYIKNNKQVFGQIWVLISKKNCYDIRKLLWNYIVCLRITKDFYNYVNLFRISSKSVCRLIGLFANTTQKDRKRDETFPIFLTRDKKEKLLLKDYNSVQRVRF